MTKIGEGEELRHVIPWFFNLSVDWHKQSSLLLSSAGFPFTPAVDMVKIRFLEPSPGALHP